MGGVTKPSGWEVEPDEFLGVDEDGAEYYVLKGNVYKRRDGYTAWLSTTAAFPTYLKATRKVLTKAPTGAAGLADALLGLGNDAAKSIRRHERKIDAMTSDERSYVETALWSSMDESTPSGGRPMDENYGVGDISPETLTRMLADWNKFFHENSGDIEAYSGGHGGPFVIGAYLFWMSRNGHGTGFWDHDGDYPEGVAERLHARAKAYGEFNLYVEDDGKIRGEAG